MSDDFPISEKQRQAALERLRSRVARLQRLIDLEAPDVILIMESQLVSDAAEMLNPHAFHKLQGDKSAVRMREMLGLCVDPSCQESAAGCDVPPALTRDYCHKHVTEAIQEALEDDTMCDDDDDDEGTA